MARPPPPGRAPSAQPSGRPAHTRRPPGTRSACSSLTPEPDQVLLSRPRTPSPLRPASTPGPIHGCASIRSSPPLLAAPTRPPPAPGTPPLRALGRSSPGLLHPARSQRENRPANSGGTPARRPGWDRAGSWGAHPSGRAGKRTISPQGPPVRYAARRENGDSPRFGLVELTREARLPGAAGVGPGTARSTRAAGSNPAGGKAGGLGSGSFRGDSDPCPPTQPWARVLTSPAYCFSVLKYRPSVLTSPNQQPAKWYLEAPDYFYAAICILGQAWRAAAARGIPRQVVTAGQLGRGPARDCPEDAASVS
ncbi:unnamed protein product [Rangifer tarandus platyrhynchus]|uniref:Uncharacterized protein n=2 Tax=Rangifer tarandus platyrhynchus TaxID=3082113 RepID=A0ABN8YT54_RANTA|nr:unnamed protein product [Rangifer tarandus platyrhynchus]CAI9702286.1 unnamed protein product [Rangifer tarandus platyrhynchus]